MEVTKANLATYLAGLSPSATPYPIEITETVASDWGSSQTAGTVGNTINTNTPSGVYLDLGLTVIPNSVISMSYTLYNCTSLTTAPIIPNSVINMYRTFYYCTSLTTAPIIPNRVTGMSATFYYCTSLTTAPVIPNSVTSMSSTFSYCTSLTTAPVIPNSVTDMTFTFSYCTSLTTAPVIPNSVTSMYHTFRGCTLLNTIQNFAVDVDNCDMTDAFFNCLALANIYVTTLTESSWHLLHTNTGATGTNYTIYNPDGTVAGSGTVAGTSQVLTLYGKSDELVISANITPTLAVETATSQVQWHKSGLPYDDELMIFNAKNPDTVISNFITVNRAGEEFLGNASTATTATTATLATQANAIKPLGDSITLPATPTSTTKIIKIATVSYTWSGTIKIRVGGVAANISLHFGQRSDISGVIVTYDKEISSYCINKIIVTRDGEGGYTTRNIYIEFANYPNISQSITLGVVETNAGVFTPSMTEVSSVEGTVLDSLNLNYTRGDISSYQHVFTKNIIGNVTGDVTGNAATATKLETARKINGVDFDGTADVYDTYSTAEHRIGTWIDGKPIYRKVVNFGALPNTTVKLVAHGITNLDNVTRLSGIAHRGSGSSAAYLTLPHANTSNVIYSVHIAIAGNDVEIQTGSDRSNYPVSIVIIEYTKTTD